MTQQLNCAGGAPRALETLGGTLEVACGLEGFATPLGLLCGPDEGADVVRHGAASPVS